MADDNQAQADSTETTGEDPSLDTSRNPDDIGATDLAEYNALVAKALEPGEEPAPEEDANEADDVAPEEEEEQPEEESEEEAEEPAAEEESTEEEEAPAEEKPSSNRFRFKDPMDQAVAALAKAKGISLLEAAEQMRKIDAPAKSEEEVEQTPARTVAQVRGEIEALRTQRKEKRASLDMEGADEIQGKIEDLNDELSDLRVAEAESASTKRQTEQQVYADQEAEAERKCTTFYPDTRDPGSPLVKRIEELHAEAVANGDPVAESPSRAFIYAKAAAVELGILMSGKTKTAPVVKKAPARRPVEPASGNARTTTPASPASKLDTQIDGVKTMGDYEELVGALAQA